MSRVGVVFPSAPIHAQLRFDGVDVGYPPYGFQTHGLVPKVSDRTLRKICLNLLTVTPFFDRSIVGKSSQAQDTPITRSVEPVEVI